MFEYFEPPRIHIEGVVADSIHQHLGRVIFRVQGLSNELFRYQCNLQVPEFHVLDPLLIVTA